MTKTPGRNVNAWHAFIVHHCIHIGVALRTTDPWFRIKLNNKWHFLIFNHPPGQQVAANKCAKRNTAKKKAKLILFCCSTLKQITRILCHNKTLNKNTGKGKHVFPQYSLSQFIGVICSHLYWNFFLRNVQSSAVKRCALLLW